MVREGGREGERYRVGGTETEGREEKRREEKRREEEEEEVCVSIASHHRGRSITKQTERN